MGLGLLVCKMELDALVPDIRSQTLILWLRAVEHPTVPGSEETGGASRPGDVQGKAESVPQAAPTRSLRGWEGEEGTRKVLPTLFTATLPCRGDLPVRSQGDLFTLSQQKRPRVCVLSSLCNLSHRVVKPLASGLRAGPWDPLFLAE